MPGVGVEPDLPMAVDLVRQLVDIEQLRRIGNWCRAVWHQHVDIRGRVKQWRGAVEATDQIERVEVADRRALRLRREKSRQGAGARLVFRGLHGTQTTLMVVIGSF